MGPIDTYDLEERPHGFSGVSCEMEKITDPSPFMVGDWVRFEDHQKAIAEATWFEAREGY